MGRFVEILNKIAPPDHFDMAEITNENSAKQVLEALERRCPDGVSVAEWQQSVADGWRFVRRWGDQAVALGWTTIDLFGLHDPPERPAPNYRRLSRYDATGLIWFLHGRQVVALTTDSAVIGTPTGGVLTFYKRKVR